MSARIPLLNRYGALRGYALTDEKDAEWLNEWTWRLSPKGYAVRFDATLKRQVYMHRAIAGLALGDAQLVDHVSRDKLDNRRSNLRVVTPAQSNHNLPSYRGSTSRFRGVCWDRRLGRWLAYGQLNRRHFNLGSFATEAAAARAAADWRAEHMPYSEEALAR